MGGEMNYPAVSHGISKARQQYENHLEASFGVWTRGAINKDMNGRIGKTANRQVCHVSQLHPLDGLFFLKVTEYDIEKPEITKLVYWLFGRGLKTKTYPRPN
jgi:hypothetical protein